MLTQRDSRDTSVRRARQQNEQDIAQDFRIAEDLEDLIQLPFLVLSTALVIAILEEDGQFLLIGKEFGADWRVGKEEDTENAVPDCYDPEDQVEQSP